MKIEFSKGLAVTVICSLGIVIVGQIVLFLKLQSLQQDFVGLKAQDADFELSQPTAPPEEFPSFLSEGISPAEHRNPPLAEVDHDPTLQPPQPPRKLEGTEKAKPITAVPKKLREGKSLLSEEEKQKIWREAFHGLDDESMQELLRIGNSIERSDQQKKRSDQRKKK